MHLITPPPNTIDEFYAECLEVAKLANVPFAIGGYFATLVHTGIQRPTKDIDIFCKPGDFPRILNKFTSLGYSTHVEDERWLAKVNASQLGRDAATGTASMRA